MSDEKWGAIFRIGMRFPGADEWVPVTKPRSSVIRTYERHGIAKSAMAGIEQSANHLRRRRGEPLVEFRVEAAPVLLEWRPVA